jgi:calnexin
LIADDEKVANSILEKTWKPKFQVEKEKEKAEEAAASGADGLSDLQVILLPFLQVYV